MGTDLQLCTATSRYQEYIISLEKLMELIVTWTIATMVNSLHVHVHKHAVIETWAALSKHDCTDLKTYIT